MKNQIVDWEILKGLPGEGQPPHHFHTGHPTPWTEGFVVRFMSEDGAVWVGNLQGGGLDISQVLSWREANAVVVTAGGNLCDDVLFRLDDGRFAEVHLTHTKSLLDCGPAGQVLLDRP